VHRGERLFGGGGRGGGAARVGDVVVVVVGRAVGLGWRDGGGGGGRRGFALGGDFALYVLEGFPPIGLEVGVAECPALECILAP